MRLSCVIGERVVLPFHHDAVDEALSWIGDLPHQTESIGGFDESEGAGVFCGVVPCGGSGLQSVFQQWSIGRHEDDHANAVGSWITDCSDPAIPGVLQ